MRNPIVLWKGYHSEEVRELVARSWKDEGTPLILCSPSSPADWSFLPLLPSREITLAGEWGGMEPPMVTFTNVSYPERPVFGIFTSGTTRESPKLVLYSKRNIETNLAAILSFFDERRIRAIFCYPQPTHTFGLLLGYALSVWKGYPLITGEGKYSRSFHEKRLALKEEGLLTLGTPTHFQDLLAFARENGVTPSPTYSAIVGGAKVEASLWRALKNDLKIECPSIGYGASEASPGVTHSPPGKEPREDGEIGFPLPHLAVQVGPGGLEVRGDSVCLAVVQEGRIRFPDKLFLSDVIRVRDDDKVMVFEGRSQWVMNRGGEKFPLEHIEAFVREKFGLEALCFTVPDPRLGQELGMLLKSPASGVKPAIPAIVSSMATVFGRCFPVQNIWYAECFPVNENGKPDRHLALRYFEAWGQGEEGISAFPVPVRKLGVMLPHKPPMVWLDQVTAADAENGECTVKLDAQASYFGPNGVRETSFVEWIAQAYAYSRACYVLAKAGTAPAPQRAYLVSVNEARLGETADLLPGQLLTVRVRLKRELGPVSLVEGQVCRADGSVLATAGLKLFAE